MIWVFHIAAASACLVGVALGAESPVESRGGEEAGSSSPRGESVSSILGFSLIPGESGTGVPRGVVLEGVELFRIAQEHLNRLDGKDWRWVFPVYVGSVGDGLDDRIPSIIGQYQVKSCQIEFIPQFPFQPGLSYRAMFRVDAFSARLRRHGVRFQAEKIRSDPIVFPFDIAPVSSDSRVGLTHVYPSRDELPENLLKFYIHFSRSMAFGVSHRYVRLTRDDGTEIVDPFLRLDEELWDPTGTRMTLLIDPGRVKRGLRPRNQVGPTFRAGDEVRLVIAAGWQDSRGIPLEKGFEKRFRVAPPDVERPLMSLWMLKVPQAGTRDPLRISFPESMDHALLERVLWIDGPDGQALEGERAIGSGETRWEFRPLAPWKPGIHEVCAENSLEDLAGNSLGRLFEVDSFLTVSRRVERRVLKRAFQPRLK